MQAASPKPVQQNPPLPAAVRPDPYRHGDRKHQLWYAWKERLLALLAYLGILLIVFLGVSVLALLHNQRIYQAELSQQQTRTCPAQHAPGFDNTGGVAGMWLIPAR